MADEETEGEGPPPSRSAAGNQTMQLDALGDVFEDASGDVPADAALAQIIADSRAEAPAEPQVSMPPPLPPKKVGGRTILLGVIVVILAVAGGVFFGTQMLGEEEPAAQTAPLAPEQTQPEEEAAAEDPTTDEAADEEPEPIQLEEFAIPHPEDELLEDGQDED